GEIGGGSRLKGADNTLSVRSRPMFSMPDTATNHQADTQSPEDRELDELFAAAESLANEITSPDVPSDSGTVHTAVSLDLALEASSEHLESASSLVSGIAHLTEAPPRPLNDLLHDPDGSEASTPVPSHQTAESAKVSDAVASTSQEKRKPRKSVADLEAEV